MGKKKRGEKRNQATGLVNGPGPVVTSKSPGLVNGPGPGPVVTSRSPGLVNGPGSGPAPVVATRAPGLVNGPGSGPAPVVATRSPGLVNGSGSGPAPVVATRAPGLVNGPGPGPGPGVACRASAYECSGVPVPVAGSLYPSPYVVEVPECEVAEVDYSKIEFVMRGIRGDKTSGFNYGGYEYKRNEFYKITVEKKEFVAQQWCQSQMNCIDGVSSMFRVGSCIYNISRYLSVDITKVPQSLSFNPTTSGSGGVTAEILGCHTGLSRIDPNDPDLKKWEPRCAYEFYDYCAQCAVLDNNIYCLQSRLLRYPRCYITRENRWVTCYPPPPQDIFKWQVTQYMVPQPSERRILVHLTHPKRSNPYLYAWTPEPKHSWQLITRDIGYGVWTDGHPFVVDDIIYFYKPMCPPYFAAYDLTNNKWLIVRWSAEFPPGAAGYEADSMFYLGNGLLCVAKSRAIPLRDPDCCLIGFVGTRVTFSLFRFHTRYNPTVGGGDRLVIFTHLFTNSLSCPDISEVPDFISLHGAG